jgi:hypothetical protein
MLSSSIAWFLVVSGVITAVGGLVAFLVPQSLLRLAFGVNSGDGALMFFVRHWGVLIFVVGVLLVYSAYYPITRVPILSAAAIEKFAVVGLVFFGPLKRTMAMTAVAGVDGLFALTYVAYLVGL